MNEPTTRGRGRPRTITREKIAGAGIEIGLPAITFVGLAAKLGISHMALYKHVSSLEDLKTLVAEYIFEGWRLAQPEDPGCETLKPYLEAFSLSMWQLVTEHPGLAHYLLRRDAITSSMANKIVDHQARIAKAFDLTQDQSSALLFSIAYHCVAVADIVSQDTGNPAKGHPAKGNADTKAIPEEHAFGVAALIAGTLIALDKDKQKN